MADYRIRIVVDPSGAAAGSRAATREVGAIGDAADRANDRVGGLMEELRGLGGALKVAAVVAAVTKYAQITDAVKQANAQLKLATNTQAQLNAAQAKAYEIAQRNGTAYGATATLLAKNLKAANGLGIAGARAAMMAGAATSAIAAGLRVSGTSAEEAQGSIIQLGQALASGTLRGDELNSVMEGMPAVAEAIAKAMGKTTGELRALGAEGKLTSGEVLKALVAAAPGLEKLASMIPLTFGQAFEKVKNSFAQLVAGFDTNTSLGAGMIRALEIVSSVLDTLAANAGTVSNVVVGLLVSMALRSAAAMITAGAAARKLAADNLALAASANAAALAQQRQAVTSLAVARAGGSIGGAGVKAAAAEVVAASAAVAQTSGALRAAEGAAAGAAARSGLFGTALVRAATLGRAALALVGGPIGLVIAGLTAIALFAGKAALSFKPIEGSAATVGDYVAVAFEAARDRVAQVFSDIAASWDEATQGMYGSVRSFVVSAIDAALDIIRPFAEMEAGLEGVFYALDAAVTAVWNSIRDAAYDVFGQVSSFVGGVASEVGGYFATAGQAIYDIVSSLVSAVVGFFQGMLAPISSVVSTIGGWFATLGDGIASGFRPAAQVAAGAASNMAKPAQEAAGKVASAYEQGAARARKALAGISGERVVSGAEAVPGRIRRGISDAFNRSGLRGAAEQRAADRERANQGGLGAVGKPVDPKDKDKKKGAHKQTFEEILKEAQAEAQAAALTTAERERQQAVLQAQKTLKRDLTDAEKGQLTAAIRLRQTNEANLALDEDARDAAEAGGIARTKALAEAARAARDYQRAAGLDAEAAVQEKLNKAKRDGIALDPAKLAAYAQAVRMASLEADETKRLATERQRNLDLVNATTEALEGAALARVQAAANAAKGSDGSATAESIALEAEVKVQERLNAAKRDGVTLDAAKVDAYRRAVQLAGIEAATISQQEENRRALQVIADDARKSMREAISGGINDALAGKLSIKGLVKTFGDILRKQLSDQITYAIFQGGVSQSQVTAQAVNLVTPAAIALAEAAQRLVSAVPSAANDNPVAQAMDAGAGQVTAAAGQLAGSLDGGAAGVTSALGGLISSLGLGGRGVRAQGGAQGAQGGLGRLLGPQGPLSGAADKLAGLLNIQKKVVDGKTQSAGSVLGGKLMSGAAIGGVSGMLPGLFGAKTSSTGSMLGGMAGSLVGGPIGAAIGGAVGSVLGGLFKKNKQASTTIEVVNGVAQAGATKGTGGATNKTSSALAGSVADQLNSMAKTLGAGLGSVGVSVGYRPGHKEGAYRVDTTGAGKVTGVQAFESQEDAIEFAVKTAISKGVFTGLSKGVADAISSGAATVEQAAEFMTSRKDVDRQVKAMTDPVGAALDELDDRFNALRAQYKTFGEDTTNLEKLYQDQRLKTIQEATSKELDTLRSFRDELRGGSLGNRSLSEQVSFQDKAFSAIEQAKASGQKVSYDDVNSVGRALLDATRELEGNTPAYQAQVDRVMRLLDGLISDSGATNVSTLPQAVDTAPIVSAADATTAAVQQQTDALVENGNAIGQAIIRMSADLGSRLDALGSGSYGGGGRQANFNTQAF